MSAVSTFSTTPFSAFPLKRDSDCLTGFFTSFLQQNKNLENENEKRVWVSFSFAQLASRKNENENENLENEINKIIIRAINYLRLVSFSFHLVHSLPS